MPLSDPFGTHPPSPPRVVVEDLCSPSHPPAPPVVDQSGPLGLDLNWSMFNEHLNWTHSRELNYLSVNCLKWFPVFELHEQGPTCSMHLMFVWLVLSTVVWYSISISLFIPIYIYTHVITRCVLRIDVNKWNCNVHHYYTRACFFLWCNHPIMGLVKICERKCWESYSSVATPREHTCQSLFEPVHLHLSPY